MVSATVRGVGTGEETAVSGVRITTLPVAVSGAGAAWENSGIMPSNIHAFNGLLLKPR